MDPIRRFRGRPRIVKRLGAWALIVMLAAACGPAAFVPPAAPTPEAAQVYLDQVVALVEGGNVASVCSMGGGTCQHSLEAADPGAIPNTPPRVVGTRVLAPNQHADGSWDVGGRVIQVCGTDGKGDPYFSELLVFYDAGRLISTNPLFWTRTLVVTGPATAPSAPPNPCS
jgi:hypothetical protein